MRVAAHSARVLTAAVLCVLVAAAPLPSRQVPGDAHPRRLTGPVEELPEPFTTVRGARVLADGRVVVTDAGENLIVLVDFARRTRTALGRVGRGPREYLQVGAVYDGPGGDLLVFDQGQNRYLPVGPGGLADVRPMPLRVGSSGSSGAVGVPDSWVSDTAGHLFASPGFSLGADSLPLIRIGADGARDTLTRLRQPEQTDIQRSGRMVTSRIIAFSPRERWAVSPDGWAVVVRADPYRVEWFPPSGPVVRGPLVRYTPVRVSAADRQALRELAARDQLGVGLGNGREQSAPLPARRDLPAREVKPPFADAVPVIDEQGRVWVERADAADAPVRTYDVFDRTGLLRERIQLPTRTRLVSFSRGLMVLVRQDGEGSEYLQRRPWP